ncbi:MAG TPA: homoserine dehydrogenase [Tepidisphaeraceae bacterium]|jgi:homoserine dehydrogenase|nr:homoserine dehydrogenase [Tepidisphaeraceae bacterium]
MSESTIGICLLGGGIVGGGVVKLLASQAELLRRRTGVRFDIRHLVVRDAAKHAGRHGMPVTTDAKAAVDDPKVQIIVELMGGTTTAGDLVERALKLGKPVVTANKSLLAARGADLFALARKHNTCIAFEASCGGGIPIIDALQRGLVANRIDALIGIVNGTCNVILTRMTRNGWSYEQALAEAQKLGFAEADPTLDVSGRDAAQKLVVLASLAFNARIAEADLHVEGIDKLSPIDIQFAGELGYVIKLLAIGERAGDGRLALRVHPTLVHKSDVLAEVSGSFNAISVYGNALGHALFYGRGAGEMPTASAVVADLVGVATGTTALAFKQLNIFPDSAEPVMVLPMDQLKSRYYLRLTARDLPGVMAQITHALGQQGISLSAIRQHEAEDSQFVPVVITTHLAREGAIRAAVKEIDAMGTIQPTTVCLRVVDQPKEFGE